MAAAEFYARWRTGWLFLVALSGFCAVWIGWNVLPWLPHFDGPGFPRLTLMLSVEASIAASIILAVQEKQDAVQRQQARYMLHIMEALHEKILGRMAPNFDSGVSHCAAEANQTDQEAKYKMG
ncbi:MAG: DUF1003 domain-containing protein [Acetobacteraceae bacterium]